MVCIAPVGIVQRGAIATRVFDQCVIVLQGTVPWQGAALPGRAAAGRNGTPPGAEGISAAYHAPVSDNSDNFRGMTNFVCKSQELYSSFRVFTSKTSGNFSHF